MKYKIDALDSKKLNSDKLNKELLNFKRTIKNTEIKTRKYIGISEEEWEGFISPEDIERPLSFKNQIISDHISMIQCLMKVLKRKKDISRLYAFSDEKFIEFAGE